MGLGAFTPKTEKVEIPGGEFTVRGLSLEDFTVLLREHYQPAKAIFDRYVTEGTIDALDQAANGDSPLGLSRVHDVLLEAIEAAPALIGDAIARAADETDNPHLARLLPAGVQIEAIQKIVTLTLEAEGGLEKLVETVIKLAGSLTDLTASRSP
ncbi:hypothetical protein [Shimia sp.]|uniref:phage pre-tape measure protein n=1 Tax=Shimia sp. TaxID=1954381 RepID=UPI003298DBA3